MNNRFNYSNEFLSSLKTLKTLPSERQKKWHELEMYAFVHFTVTTFIDKEWGYGNESPEVFNPSDFDPGQIVSVVKNSGFKGLIFTCKHHDGFCLWPSKYTEHSIKNCSWRNGKADVVKEMSDACREQGIQFGVYHSPWDRNYSKYGAPEYLEYYKKQLKELMENYGPVFEVWFDGANGGDGYYGGACEKRKIADNYYDWENIHKLVRSIQPETCMFGKIGFDIRWVGNEDGLAGDPCWTTACEEDRHSTEFTAEKAFELRNNGFENGSIWQGAECDVSIRPGWFYHEEEDDKVKSPEELMDIYFKSVGRGASLLLNIPPDKRGKINENDVEALTGFKSLFDNIFNNNLSDLNNAKTYFIQNDKVISLSKSCEFNNNEPIRLIQKLDSEVEFNIISLSEDISFGQRINKYSVTVADEYGCWQEIYKGSSIGNKRLIKTDNIKTDRICITITEYQDFPVMKDFSIFFKGDSK